MTLHRRQLLKLACQGAFAGSVVGRYDAGVAQQPLGNSRQVSARDFLQSILYAREEVDAWLAGEAFPFAKYHSEFGWLLPNAYFRDGVDDSISVYTYVQPDGERIMGNYADQPCRINTYGNSFTQCHQVSDHETWQELLAAHLQEPVRNFGIGGWSVYQAYLRMLKEEQRTPSEYIIFNIYDDDHRRNLDAWRNIRRPKHVRFIEPTLPHVRVNAADGLFEERPNPCPTPESLYDLCDLDTAHDLFKNDFALKIMVAHQNADADNPFHNYQQFQQLASTHGIETSIETSAHLSEAAEALHTRSALFSTEKIVEKIEAYAKATGKRVLYVLSYPAGSIARRIREGTRWDQSFVDFLNQQELPYVDLMEAHVEDFRQYKIGVKEYLAQYFIGHYNPRGNLFCADALKPSLVDMLQPKPTPYRNDSQVLP